MQSSVGQQNIQQPKVMQQCQCPPQQSVQAQAPTIQQQAPQYQTAPMVQPQSQNVQVPNYSGVNIQIFNPSVATPGSTAPVYNVNAPNYGPTAASGCYPSGYYTNDWGNSKNLTSNTTTTNTTENKKTEKKTEKREIVQLTDEYIKNLENYLNSQDKEVRLMGAKEVVARLEEDHSRKDDKALNALVNKMLQDPSTAVKILALSVLDSRVATGDDYTVGLLKAMQNSKSGYGQDAMQATNILLKMSGQKVEKEFEVKDTKKSENKSNGEK
ncbi:unknown [Clostridium sp. CAG:967]|nr:unknown [Clostridium sp. CAG:967]